MGAEVDLNLLRVLIAINDERSITQAAKRLGLSQPTISGSLAKLREIFSDDLFVKTAHGMEPTERVKSLEGSIRDILSRIEHDILRHGRFDPATFSGTITFACSEVAENFLLPPVITRLLDAVPHVAIRSVLRNTEEILVEMEEGAIDIVIGYFPELARANLFQQKLFTAEFVCLVRADHKVRDKRLSIEQYARLSHISTGALSRPNDLLGRYLKKKGIKKNVAMSLSHVLSTPPLIEHSDLAITVVSALGEYLARTNPKLQLVRLPADFPSFSVCQYWHRKSHGDPKNRWLRSLVKETFQTAPVG